MPAESLQMRVSSAFLPRRFRQREGRNGYKQYIASTLTDHRGNRQRTPEFAAITSYQVKIVILWSLFLKEQRLCLALVQSSFYQTMAGRWSCICLHVVLDVFASVNRNVNTTISTYRFFTGAPTRFVTHPDYVPSLFEHTVARCTRSSARFDRAKKRQGIYTVCDVVWAPSTVNTYALTLIFHFFIGISCYLSPSWNLPRSAKCADVSAIVQSRFLNIVW